MKQIPIEATQPLDYKNMTTEDKIAELFRIRDYWKRQALRANRTVAGIEETIARGSENSLREILEDNLGVPGTVWVND